MNQTWLTIILITIFAIAITGWLTGRRLPESQKKRHMVKFQAASVIVLLYYLAFSIPYVSSYSHLSNRDYEYPQKLETVEAIAKETKDQFKRIEKLETEVKVLREELGQMNEHYKFFLIIAAMLGSSFLLNIVLSNKKEDSENEKE